MTADRYQRLQRINKAASVAGRSCALALASAVAARNAGVLLTRHLGYPLNEPWIVWPIIHYVITGIFWLPVVWMQMRLRDLAAVAAAERRALPRAYHALCWWWFASAFRPLPPCLRSSG